MKKEKKKSLFRMIAILLFAAYLCMLCYFLFFADSMGRAYTDRAYHYNVIPFREIYRFWKYMHVVGVESTMLNLGGNVIAFVPFGVFLPMLFEKCRKFSFAVLLSFEFSLAVEAIQLVLKVGCFDVDDMILNTLGGLLGFLMYLLLSHIWRRKYETTKKKK